MFDWLKRLLGGAPLQDGEVTPGGSRVYTYDGDIFQNQVGFHEKSQGDNMERRDEVYESLFGEIDQVYHEMIPFVPHIDIYTFKPGFQGRDFWTVVTAGMSDLPMTVPPDVGSEFSRVELIFYCNRVEEAYLGLLRTMAHFPHDNRTWFGFGHTVPNGQPAAPLFRPNSLMTTLLFLGTIVSPDAELGEQLVIDGDPVNFLWVVPISDAECEAKLEHGVDKLLDLFSEVSHPFVFTGDRDSYL